MEEFLTKQLIDLEQKGLRRSLQTVHGPQGRQIRIGTERVLNFCSNNYLGLADDERLRHAAITTLKQQGVGAGASRLVCGHMRMHEMLEERLAAFKGTERCVVFSTGYMANVGIISALFDRRDTIFADRLNHASIIDGILLSRARYRRYPHRDTAALARLMHHSSATPKRGIITDTVFSMDGDMAPLRGLVDLAREKGALLMVDEAHALGVLGAKGKGACEHFGCEQQVDIQMGTLSKAVGSFGAYCCGRKSLIDYLINKSRSFIYTTGMPPAIAAAALKGLEIIEREPQRREQLWANTRYLQEGFKSLGFNTGDSQTPIIPIILGAPETAVEFSRLLYEKGFFVQAIRPPTVPPGSARLRVTAMATHTRRDLNQLLDCCETVGKKLCLI